MLDRTNGTAGTAGLARPVATDAPTLPIPMLPLEVRDLHFRVDGKALIDGIDLTLQPGAITMVMGPNGAGKSLLLRLLHGLLTPSAGTVNWAGTGNGEAARKRQAMVFQRAVLLRRSVAANMDFALSLQGKVDRDRRDALLESVGLLDRANQPARLLSGGEQQRLALARALAGTPDVLFLDEPTANLDPASVHLIEQIVQAAHASGTRIIFITHDIGQARRLGDEIVFLHHGRLVEQTSAEQFFTEPASEAARTYLDGRLVL